MTALILVIVDNLDLECIAVAPDEADAPLPADPDAVLSVAIAAQFFEPVARICEIAQLPGLSDKTQLSERRALDVLRETPGGTTIVDRLGLGVGEAPNHIVLSVMHTRGGVKHPPRSLFLSSRARLPIRGTSAKRWCFNSTDPHEWLVPKLEKSTILDGPTHRGREIRS